MPALTQQQWDEVRRAYVDKGRLMPEVARAREVLSLMRAGALDGLSIGFRTILGRRDAKTGIRRLVKVDLWEISIVTFPLLPEARVAHVKARPFAHAAPRTEREFERWLTRDGGFSSAQARAVLRHGFKGLLARRAGSCHPDGRLVARIEQATRLVLDSTRR